MMTSQNPRTRTVSLRRARLSQLGAILMSLACLAVVLIALAASHPLLLVFPVIGLTSGLAAARGWSRAIRRARHAPDEYRWTPDDC
jgi:hypothetical protein